ncbi:protein of unknown function [Rhodovastum atsumiense]|nr:protein of unknown function [Rhodovastum atsumiense]
MAPAQPTPACARQHQPAAPASLRAGIEPDGERLGISAGQQAQSARMEQLQRHPGRLPGCLELSDGYPRHHQVHHSACLGIGQNLGRLVSLIARQLVSDRLISQILRAVALSDRTQGNRFAL